MVVIFWCLSKSVNFQFPLYIIFFSGDIFYFFSNCNFTCRSLLFSKSCICPYIEIKLALVSLTARGGDIPLRIQVFFSIFMQSCIQCSIPPSLVKGINPGMRIRNFFPGSGSGSAEKSDPAPDPTLMRNEKKKIIYFNEKKYLYYSNSSPPIRIFGFIQEFS